MKGLETMREMAGRGVIIEWNDHPIGKKAKTRQASIFEFFLCSNGLLRRGEAKFI